MDPEQNHSGTGGFALVLGLLLSGLITAVVLGFAMLSSVESQLARQARLQIEARETARLALHMAIGQLQQSAGPDQRVTASANLLGDAVAPGARGWTGVWNTADPAGAPDWLVSGLLPDPRAPAGPQVELLAGHEEGEDGRGNIAALEVPLVDIPGWADRQFAWWVADEGAKAALRPLRVMLDESPESEEAGYLDYNENTLHAARFRQNPGFGFPLLYDPSETEISNRLLAAASTAQLEPLAARLPEDLRKRAESELRHSVCLESRFVLSNPLDGGLKKDLSYCKTLSPADLSDDSLRTYYNDPDDLLRADAARLIQHRADPSAKQNTRSNARMRLPAGSAEEAAGRFQCFSLAPVVTELQLVLALAATPLEEKEETGDMPNHQLLLAYKLILELWNPYTVPFLLGEDEAGGQPGHSDLRCIIRNLPDFHLEKASGSGVVSAGTLPDIEVRWSRDSGIRRYRKLMRPGMVFRKSLPAATARREVLTRWLDDIRTDKDEAFSGSFTFRGNVPLEIELYGIDPGGDERSFFKAGIRGYPGFTNDYAPASENLSGRLLHGNRLRRSLLEDNPNAFAFCLRMLDEQSPENGSHHYSRLLSEHDLRRPLLEADLDALDPDDPWGCDPPLPYDFTVDGQSHDPSKYGFRHGFLPGDVFHHNEDNSLGGRKDRVARAFDFPVGEIADIGIFRSLVFSDYPANAIGNPAGGALNRLYDRYFFSTLPDPGKAEWDGSRPLANARIRSFKTIPRLDSPGTASGLLLHNGFNLNAASPLAWEKILSGRQFPSGQFRIKHEEPNGKPDWKALEEPVRNAHANFPQTALFNQSEHASGEGYRFITRSGTRDYGESFSTRQTQLADDRQHPALRQNIRELAANEVAALADAVAASLRQFVRDNGRPPLSLAEYLNAGILQQAIDATPALNQRAEGYDNIPRHGTASITQATLMNALGPLAFVRSDSFTVRAYARIGNQPRESASALCQAQVQRIPEPSASGFGRRFVVLGFQWLHPSAARL